MPFQIVETDAKSGIRQVVPHPYQTKDEAILVVQGLAERGSGGYSYDDKRDEWLVRYGNGDETVFSIEEV